MVYIDTSVIQIASNYSLAFPHNRIRLKILYPKILTISDQY